jgi:formylglycine-generating enzyme
MKLNNVILIVAIISFLGLPCMADCPPADLSGDCFVDFHDFAVLASEWLTGGRIIPPSDVNMVLIPYGTFLMGDGFSEGDPVELPLHTVTLSPFSIGRYDITNAQYCDFLNTIHLPGLKIVSGVVYASSDSSNSYPYCDTSTSNINSQIAYGHAVFSVRTKGSRNMANDPVIDVSWYGAAAYCNWRSQQEGKAQCYNTSDPNWPCDFTKNGYHLPTEAQWEYAARGGLDSYRFPWGDTISQSQSNYQSMGNSYDLGPTGFNPTWNSDGLQPFTSPVGSFPANGYGLCDVAGNVYQWCNDWYGSYSYSPSPQANPTGPTSGMYRILRGGSWFESAYIGRVSNRLYGRPVNRNYSNSLYGYGFRVAMDLH